MRRDAVPHGWALTTLTAVCTAVLFVVTMQVSGAERQKDIDNSAASFRRVPVPADRPDLWPKGSWQAVPLDEFQRLLKAARTRRPRLKPVWIERAIYTATFAGRSLRGGRLTATVRRTSHRNELLTLDPLNLPLLHPVWSGHDAVWGTTREGRTALIVRWPRDTLRARWSLAGRRLVSGVEFDIHVAPAGVSRLELRLPDGYQLAASAGVVSKPTAAETGWKLWRVDLGSLADTRVTIGRVAQQTALRPLILADTDTSYVVRREGTQFQTSYNLEIVQAPVTHLRFQVPPELDIDRLTYGGEETLSWQSKPSAHGKTIVVRLPDALRGRSRPLRIDGFTTTRPGRDRPLPRIRLKGAIFLSGQSHLRVAAPLELLSFSQTGCRQTGIVASAAEGETFTFDDDLPGARLTIRVGLPPLELSSRIITRLLATADDRKLTADVEWTAHRGSTFFVQCTLPADWRLLDVTAGSQSPGSRVTNWEIARRDSKRQVLSIEFLDALTPGSPKTVRILARRDPATPSRITRFPVVRPRGCRSGERLLAVLHPTTIAIRLLGPSPLKPIREADLPDFVRQSPLWKQIGADSESARLLFYANTESAAAVALFGQADPPINVDLRTTLKLGPDRLTEEQQIDVVPRGAPLSRVFVYLTTSGPAFRWTLSNRPGTVLAAKRVPESRYAAWNLPENPDGELWEILLPTRQRTAFRLSGTRSHPVASRILPALAFVPGATKFHGRIDLTTTGGVDVDTQVQGLQRRPPTSRPAKQTGSVTTRQSWEYRGPDGSLVLRFHPDVAGKNSDIPASLILRSLISPLADGADLHRATFSFGAMSYPEPFQFELPSFATLTSVRLNGQTVLPRRIDRRYTLSVLPANRRNTVEIRYHSSSVMRTAGLGNVSRDLSQVAVPSGSCKVVSFDWHVALPPGVALAAEPDGVRLDRPLPSPTWSARLFGPLGRPADSPMFTPWSLRSWQELLTGDRDATTGNHAGGQADPSFPPADWIVVHGTAVQLPDVLTLKLRDTGRGRLIAWIVLMAVLLVGLTVRARRYRGHRLLLVLWVSLCLTAAWLTPVGIVQQIAAGSLAGTILAWILPRSLIAGQRSGGGDDAIPTGSTVSLPGGAVMMGLLTVGCLFVQAAAEEGSLPDRTGPGDGTASAAAAVAVAAPERLRTVLIPVGPDHKPSTDLPVVYLTKPDLAALRASAKHATAPRYLISSAEYRTTIDAHHFVTIEASYHVVTLTSPNESARLFLRLTGGNPIDCLVNGRPQPLFRAPEGAGLVIELTSAPAGEPVVAPKPMPARGINGGTSPGARPDSAAARSSTEREFDVLVRLHPRTSALPAGSRFSIGLPPVADSHLSLDFAGPQQTIDVAGARSPILPGDDHRSAAVELGKIDRLTVTWSEQSLPVRKPPRLEADILCRIEAQPTQLQLRYRLAYRVLSGPVDFVVWSLPTDAIIRSVTGDHLLSYHTITDADGRSRLLIEFQTPQDDRFRVEAAITLPVRTPGRRIRIPAIDLTKGAFSRQTTTIVSNQIGVSAPAVFRLSDPRFVAEQVIPISAESLATAWSRAGGATSGFGKPRFAYQLSKPTAFSFAIAPLTSGRTVRLHQTGRIGRKRLTWTATAEITVDPAGAPVFQHNLRVDPRLSIESLSVKEDAAERLVRYARRGDRVTLFLSDGSTGIQDLVLTGSMPLPLPGDTRLPIVRFESAAVATSDLILLRDPSVTVDLPDRSGLKTVKPAGSPPAEDARSILIGRFLLTGKTAPAIIRIRRSLRSVRADLITVIQFRANRRRIVTTCIRYRGLQDTTAALRLRLPAKLATNYRLTADGYDSRAEPRPDGSLDVLLVPRVKSAADRAVSDRPNPPRSPIRPRSIRRSLTVVLSSTLTMKTTREWEQRTVEPLNVTIGSRELFVPVHGPMRAVGLSPETSPPRTLPLWVRRAAVSLSAAKPRQRWTVYRLRKESWKLTDTATSQPNRTPRVLFVGTVARPTAHGRVYGSTEILFVPAGADHLDIICPSGFQLRALFVDGTVRSLPKMNGDRLSILIEQPFTPRQIVLHWTGDLDAPVSLFGRQTLALPGPYGVPVDQSLVSLIPSSEIRLLNLDGAEPIDSTTRQNDRNAALVQFRRSLAESRAARLIADQPAGTMQPESLSTAISGRFVSSRVVPETDGRIVLSYWPVEDRTIVGTLAIAACLVLIPVGLVLSRMGIGPWLRERGSLAWMLLGLAWWTCLNPSGLGLMLILLGLITAVRRHLRRSQLRRQSAEAVSSLA